MEKQRTTKAKESFMAWREVEFTKNRIKKAGKVIVNAKNHTDEEVKLSIAVADNWRQAHAYPLFIVSNHIKRLSISFPNTLVVSRLKRLDSIIAKLARENTMSLCNMQDLGGCRVIVDKLEDVYSIANKYQTSRIKHICCRTNDYIQQPKKSGYRSLHKVYSYTSTNPESCYNKMCIEVQFRTHLQHLWATAVETMGIYSKENLKASQGQTAYLRFFTLASALIANIEGTPFPPDVPKDVSSIRAELRSINRENNIINILSAINVAAQYSAEAPRNRKGYYLLVLNFATRRLRITYFQPSRIDAASQAYANIEAQRQEKRLDAVLVSAESFDMLKKAYPNYFADIGEFVTLMLEHMNGLLV